jgi:hypothetical protein
MTRLQILFAFLTTLLASTPALAVYSPELGRWRQRDPAGYVDSSNLAKYVRSSPVCFVDPSGLKLTVNGTRNQRKQVQESIQQLCPGATVEDDGSVTVPEFDPASCAGKKDENGNDCGESPGCGMLRDLNDSPNSYPVKTGGVAGFYWDWSTGTVLYLIRYSPTRTKQIHKIDDRGRRVFDRDAQPWEVFWHELTHAHRHSTGEHPFDENALPYRNPTDAELAKEEVDTINKMNELRKWWQHCGPGSDGPNNISPRDPNGH